MGRVPARRTLSHNSLDLLIFPKKVPGTLEKGKRSCGFEKVAFHLHFSVFSS